MEDMEYLSLEQLITKAIGNRTLRQFANIIGVNASTISRICSGQIRLSDELIQKIVDNADTPGSVTTEMFFALCHEDKTQIRRNRFEEMQAVTSTCESIIMTDLLKRGYSLFSTSDITESRFDFILRTDALGSDTDNIWGFEILHPFFKSATGVKKQFNDGALYSPLWRCTAALYLGQAHLNRFSLVTCDEDFFGWLIDKCTDMKPLGEISIILVDGNKKRITKEYILPTMDGHIPATPFDSSTVSNV